MEGRKRSGKERGGHAGNLPSRNGGGRRKNRPLAGPEGAEAEPQPVQQPVVTTPVASAPAPVAAPVPSTVSAPAPAVNRPAQAPVVNTEVKPKREKFFSSINITFGIGVLLLTMVGATFMTGSWSWMSDAVRVIGLIAIVVMIYGMALFALDL